VVQAAASLSRINQKTLKRHLLNIARKKTGGSHGKKA
jgi:hypothetical protein